MTGMGDDGAAGMKEIHDTGAYTIAQDEKTSVVYGMPAVAVAQGGVDKILALNKIAAALVNNESSARILNPARNFDTLPKLGQLFLIDSAGAIKRLKFIESVLFLSFCDVSNKLLALFR